MADILPRDLPAAGPIDAEDDVIIIQQTGTVRKTSPSDIVNETNPVATESEAQAGTDNAKRMTALRVKQSIAAETGTTIATYAQGQRADSAVQPARTISAGAGLTGGGTLAENRTIALNSTSLDSLDLADSAVQPDDLGALATKNTINNSDWSGDDLDIANGGTGASTAAAARTNLGLGALATKDQIVVADIDAAGTPDVNTYLRGDGTWSAGGAVGGRVDSVAAGSGITVDSSDPVAPVVSLDAASIASLDLADSSVQSVNGKTGSAIALTPADIGAATASQGTKSDNAVQFVSQSLTTAQQTQARVNIGSLGGIALAARRAVITDASGNLTQTSLTDAMKALLGLTGAADRLPYLTGTSAAALTALTAFARSILDDANGAAMFETMGATKTHGEVGYAKNPDGTITQWGSSVVTTESEIEDISFPVTFPTACATVVVCNGDTTTQGGTVFGTHAKYADRFTLRTNGHSGTVRANWIAVGY